MILKNKGLLFFILIIILIILFSSPQRWIGLNYDVTLNSDGSMDVVETWNIFINETNTLFKNFDIDKSKYSGISNVKVSEVRWGKETFLKEIHEEQYHVDKGCYYGLPIKDNSQFEIAWNVDLDNSFAFRKYKIYYKIENVAKVYNDCTEVYWQFLGTKNEIPGTNITGKIKLPKKVDDIEKFRIWGHGNLIGKIKKAKNDLIKFNVPILSKNTMLEVRVVTEENIYDRTDNKYDKNYLNSILSEEKKWADEANAERDKTKKRAIGILIDILNKFMPINIFFLVLFTFKIIKYIKVGKELKEKYSNDTNSLNELKYFREIPNEEIATPARALYLYKFKNFKSNFNQSDISKIFSATILDLSLKKIIHFEPEGKNDIRIFLDIENRNMNFSEDIYGRRRIIFTDEERKIRDLPNDEKKVLRTLIESLKDKDSITNKEFKKYTKKNYELIYERFSDLEEIIETDVSDGTKKHISKQIQNKLNRYSSLFWFTFIFIFITLALPTIPIGLMICKIILSKNLKSFSILNEEGMAEAQKWIGLKNYITDYSLIREKEVPDIALWEKYLVYATVFGISKKVIEKLKIVYPEMFIAENTNHDYGYWNIITNSNSRIIDPSKFGVGDAYSKGNRIHNSSNGIGSSSSSRGGGGGFSSGGRRPVAAEAAVEVVRI